MKHFLWAIALFAFFAAPALAADGGAKESAYDRVMRTGTIRCGYASFHPSIIIDPETGELSGIFYDLMNEVGARLHLKVEWTEEVGYGVIQEGFKAGRYDAFCGAVSPTPERARDGVFTIPAYYSPIGVWVRKDDDRFDQDYGLLNNADYRLATKDGDLQETIAMHDFPDARRVAIPQMADTTQNLMDVVMGKADAVFVEPYYANAFMKTNPGALKNVAAGRPVRIFPDVMMLPANEFQLKMMIDTTLQELLFSGFVEKLVEKYTGDKDTYYTAAAPYRIPQP